MPQMEPKPGDYIDAGNDEGTVYAVKGGWVYYHSDVTGRTAKRLETSCSVNPTVEQIYEMAKELRKNRDPRVLLNIRPTDVAGKVGRNRNKQLLG